MWSGRERSLLPHLPALFWWQLRSSTSTANQNIPLHGTAVTHCQDTLHPRWLAGNSGGKQHFCQTCPQKPFQFPLCWTSQGGGSCCFLSHSQGPALTAVLWQCHPPRGDSGQKHIKAGRKMLFNIFFLAFIPFKLWILKPWDTSVKRFFHFLRRLRALCDLCTCVRTEEKRHLALGACDSFISFPQLKVVGKFHNCKLNWAVKSKLSEVSHLHSARPACSGLK